MAPKCSQEYVLHLRDSSQCHALSARVPGFRKERIVFTVASRQAIKSQESTRSHTRKCNAGVEAQTFTKQTMRSSTQLKETYLFI